MITRKKTRPKGPAGRRSSKTAGPKRVRRSTGKPAVRSAAKAGGKAGATRAKGKANPRAATQKAKRAGLTKSVTRRVLAKRPTRAATAKVAAAPAAPVAAKPAQHIFSPQALRVALLELVRKTSAELPQDVVKALQSGKAQETDESNALWAMRTIEENIELAKDKSAPLCQDTGTIIFYVKAPSGVEDFVFRREAEAAVAQATAKGYLRQNSVDSLTGRNSGNNLGPGSPVIHFRRWRKPVMDVRLILKGGGCENVGAQYSLPDTRLQAGRDLTGVEKCLLDAVYQAQGKGCGPGILGVTIGGDRATGYEHSKEQLLRTLDDVNANQDLAALESRVVDKANQLGIGPMGFGGRTTLLGCKIGVLNRLPASFFVSISYMCWAYRRQGVELTPDGSIRRWFY
jgi:fumarate hydratase, class I